MYNIWLSSPQSPSSSNSDLKMKEFPCSFPKIRGLCHSFVLGYHLEKAGCHPNLKGVQIDVSVFWQMLKQVYVKYKLRFMLGVKYKKKKHYSFWQQQHWGYGNQWQIYSTCSKSIQQNASCIMLLQIPKCLCMHALQIFKESICDLVQFYIRMLIYCSSSCKGFPDCHMNLYVIP